MFEFESEKALLKKLCQKSNPARQAALEDELSSNGTRYENWGGDVMKNCLGKIWSFPTTFVGLFLGFAGYCIAPRKIKIRFGHNAICFYNHPFMRGRSIALTLGNIILFQQDNDYFMGINIAEHEKQHTRQAEVLGIFYIPLHIVCLAVYGRNVLQNPLERGPYFNPPKPW